MPQPEHSVLQFSPIMHPNMDGIFHATPEERYQLKTLMRWLTSQFEEPSLHALKTSLSRIEFRNDMAVHIPDELNLISEKIKRTWVESHGLPYNEEEIVNAFKTADSDIEVFASGLFSRVLQIQPINEVASEQNPVILLAYALISPNPRVRYESARKLYLGNMALSDEKVRKDDKPRIDHFYRLLDAHMFNDPTGNIQANPTETNDTYFLSYHTGEDFRCTFVRELKEGELLDESVLRATMRIHTIPMRTWYDNDGKPHQVLFESRIKNAAKFNIKELRNDTANPQTLDDNIGGKFTFKSLDDAELFIKTLISKPISISPIIRGVDFSIKRDGAIKIKEFNGVHAASSKDFEIIKYHILINGALYEIQVNTIRTWIDQQFRDGVCWDDYEMKRLTMPDKKDGIPVTELLFPFSIYGVNLKELAEPIVKYKQVSRRNAPITIPEKLRRHGRVTKIMHPSELRNAVDKLAVQILSASDLYTSETERIDSKTFIVIADADGNNLLSTAKLLGQKMGLAPTHVLTNDLLTSIPKKSKIVIFDDIFRNAKNIKQVMAELKTQGHDSESIITAVIAADETVKPDGRLISAMTMRPQTRILFPAESEKRIYKESAVFLSTRKGDDGDTEILMEELSDGKFKIPGGGLENEETPVQTMRREMFEEFGKTITEEHIVRTLNPVMTTFQPHNDLSKPYSPYMMHYIFEIKPDIFENGLPEEFRWVNIKAVSHLLYWQGQRELWSKLRDDKII